jgi:hypothetical protein
MQVQEDFKIKTIVIDAVMGPRSGTIGKKKNRKRI